MKALDILGLARARGATDVTVTWNGRGSVALKRHGCQLESHPLERADVVCRQLLVMAGLDALPTMRGASPLRLGTLVHEGAPVRVTAMYAARTFSVSVRLHSVNALGAAARLLDGSSCEGLRDGLERRSGILLVAGPASSGKTTLLSAMLNSLGARSAVVASECEEMRLPAGVPLFPLPTGFEDGRAQDALGRFGAEVVVIDEGVESQKMRLAVHLAPNHLVVATLKVPHLAGAIHMLRIAMIEAHHAMPGNGRAAHLTWPAPLASLVDERCCADVVGIVRTSATPRPGARYFAVDPADGGHCPYCGGFRPPGASCPGCGARHGMNGYERLSNELLSSYATADVTVLCQQLESRGASGGGGRADHGH